VIVLKRLLLIPLLLSMVVLGAAPAVASPPQEAAGEWTYVPDLAGLTFRPAGNATFIHGSEDSTFTGTFEGTSYDEFVVRCIQKGPETVLNTGKLMIEFTGEVDGRVGGLTIMALGKQDSTTCGPSGAIWYGTWVILGGSGELANLHGHGTWTGPSLALDYAGEIHFD
jgi:hypothetical protein